MRKLSRFSPKCRVHIWTRIWYRSSAGCSLFSDTPVGDGMGAATERGVAITATPSLASSTQQRWERLQQLFSRSSEHRRRRRTWLNRRLSFLASFSIGQCNSNGSYQKAHPAPAHLHYGAFGTSHRFPIIVCRPCSRHTWPSAPYPFDSHQNGQGNR